MWHLFLYFYVKFFFLYKFISFIYCLLVSSDGLFFSISRECMVIWMNQSPIKSQERSIRWIYQNMLFILKHGLILSHYLLQSELSFGCGLLTCISDYQNRVLICITNIVSFVRLVSFTVTTWWEYLY